GRRQVLPMSFKVTFTEDNFLTLDVQGEPLAPGKAISGKRQLDVQFGRPQGFTRVTQIYDWRTVPVKRVDKVELGYLSSRTAQMPLKPPTFFKEPEDPQKADGATSQVTDTGLQAPGRTLPGGSGSGKTDLLHTENKLERYRYVEASEQVRRMPFGLVVVVDQNHIRDFLTEVANSPLR